MSEKLKRYPSAEGFKQAFTDLGKTTFIGCEICGFNSSIFGGGVKRRETRVTIVYGVDKPRDGYGELIFGITTRRKDATTLGYQPKEGFVIPLSGRKRARYDNEIIGPFAKTLAPPEIAGVDFEHPDQKTTRISLWLKDGSRVCINTSREAKGRVMVREKGVYQGELLLPTGFYLRPSEGLTEG